MRFFNTETMFCLFNFKHLLLDHKSCYQLFKLLPQGQLQQDLPLCYQLQETVFRRVLYIYQLQVWTLNQSSYLILIQTGEKMYELISVEMKITHQYLYLEKHCNLFWWYWQQDKTHYTCNASEEGKEVGLPMRDGKAKLSCQATSPFRKRLRMTALFLFIFWSALQYLVLYKRARTKKSTSKNEN